ncbi:MAG: OmpA family protein [Bacteroidetes bacterium]|nr:OmpA family protein [Bacteroidota bacterium]
MKGAILIFSSMVFFCSSGYGQIIVDDSLLAEFYVRNVLLGSGVEVANIKHVGMVGGLGQFNADPGIIGVGSGLVLSTGSVDSIGGPNNARGFTSLGTLPESRRLISQLSRGDKDLNRLCHGRTIDITVIEFDFVPLKNVLEFNYVFASEEYTEFVGSPFNDVFGFFLSGPGIKKKVNLAVLPDGKTPVSVNTVNHRKNKNYFRKNGKRIGLVRRIFKSKKKLKEMIELRKYIQFDGLTTVLKVHCDVVPYQKYHIKIAIGDVADGLYDSAVFLEAGSFVSIKDTSGKYFEKLEVLSENPPDIDSIFGIKVIAEEEIPLAIDDKFEITNVYFDHDSYSVPDSAKNQLDYLAGYLLENPGYTCVLYGYTDNLGSKNYNQTLSERRAKTILDYLVTKGVDSSRLVYFGLNFEQPNDDNSTESGRAKNRRVEIVLEE